MLVVRTSVDLNDLEPLRNSTNLLPGTLLSRPRPGILATPWCVPQRAGLFVDMHACYVHL